MLKVYKESCKNCLLSKDRIVPPSRATGIIKSCIKEQTYFICHKATVKGEEVICKSFFDNFGHHSQLVRIAGRLNAIEFVDQPGNEKLPSYKEQTNLGK